MTLDRNDIAGQVLGVLVFIRNLKNADRTTDEREWLDHASATLIQLWHKVSPHLRDLHEQVNITFGRHEIAPTGLERPKEEKNG